MLERLAAACREFPLREKIVVVPSLAIGHQIGDAIARRGTPWINLRFETARTIADAVAGFELTRRGVTVLSRAQALALIESACDQVLDSASYFAPLAERPGLHRAVQKSLDDLRSAGVDGAKLGAATLEDARKTADLVRILEAYEKELERGKYIDRLGVLETAIAMLDQGGSSWPADVLWFVLDDLELTVREERLVALASSFVGASPLTRPRDSGATLSPLTRGEGISISSEGSPGSLQFRRAVGEENEIRGAFRALLAARERIDDAELIYTTRDPYLPLAFELASEYSVPCTFAEGIPAYFTRPGQACLAFLRWIGEGWHATELQRFADGKTGRTVRKAAIGWGRGRYLPRIDAWIASRETALEEEENETRLAGIERAITEARESRAFVESLLTMTAGVAESISVASAARAAAAFVATTRVRNEIDVMAREGLGRMFAELAAVEIQVDAVPRRPEITTRLADAVRSLHVSASNPRPGHLHVAPIRAGGWSSRSLCFVAGLDEDRHPGSGLQDPILLDVERETIGMPIVGDRPQRTSLQFQRLLERCAGRQVTLSWPSLRLRDRRELFPSTALLDAYRSWVARPAPLAPLHPAGVMDTPQPAQRRLFDENPQSPSPRLRGEGPGVRGEELAGLPGYEQLIAAATEERFVDPTPLSASEWWLMRRFSDADTNLADAVLAAYPSLAAGARAEAARNSDAITAWDGKIDAPPEEVDPRLNGRTYSASQLERMAGCPFRYFLERVLYVTPLEELAFDPDTWLEAREFGSLLHEVLEQVMNELSRLGTKPTLAFLPRMEEIARASLEEWRGRIPPPGETAYERRERELLRSCEVFLRSEERSPAGVNPAHFEMGFDAFALPLGGGRTITLRGFIDRIDRDEAKNEWHVWDYKSGLSRDFEGDWNLLCGTKMQHAIYARAVEARLGGRVTMSGYVFPTTRGRGARIVRDCSDADLKRALNLLSDVVGSGWFPHADQCRWCEFEAVCDGAQRGAERTAAKLAANPADDAVAAWQALKGVK